MRYLRMICLALLALTAVTGDAFASPPARHPPSPVIFDTDMWGDIDDMLALAMLHALEDRGEMRLVAITSSTTDPWCVSYIDAVDSFYGRPHIPIGMTRNGVTAAMVASTAPGADADPTNYTQYIAQRRRPDGRLLYPHALRDGSRAPDAMALLRKTLAAQPDDSVVIVSVGFFTNMARLLQSPPDAYSPLDGAALVKKKVRLLSTMAGSFQQVRFQDRIFPADMQEFNIAFDVPAAQQMFEHWPTPIVNSGFEIGARMMFSGKDAARFSDAEANPIAETYRYSDILYRRPDTPKGQLSDHATFDMTSVLYAIRSDQGYFDLSPSGRISISPAGISTFQTSPDGPHRHLVMTDSQRIKANAAMTELVIQPPKKAKR